MLTRTETDIYVSILFLQTTVQKMKPFRKLQKDVPLIENETALNLVSFQMHLFSTAVL